MPNYYEDNDDLRFYIEQWIDWEPLVATTEYRWKAADGPADLASAVELYTDVLRMVGEFSANEVAPLSQVLDTQHPVLEDGEVRSPPEVEAMFEQLAALGVHGLCVPRELGGMGAPLLLLHVNNELLARSDVSVAAHHGFHGGMAMAALMYSVREGTTRFASDPPHIEETRFREAIDEIVGGESWGSMDLTEPDAGSDLARLRCRGTLGDDGTWRVSGNKVWITSGHGRWHFVIARTESDDSGLEGLSMFLVPAWSTDADGNRVRRVHIDKLEDKLGHHGSVTVLLRFDDAPAMLIGERGEGFKQMLVLMNFARVGVGFESIGLMESAWRAAKAYSAARESMGKTIDKHEMIAGYLDHLHTDIQAVRAMAMEAGWHAEMAQKLEMEADLLAPDDEKDALRARAKRHDRKARRLTPLLKYYAAEQAVDAARTAIQVHGGYGYSSEYPVEKLLRDAMVLPIYEGTSQIQALMAMKDTLVGVMKDPSRFLTRTAAHRWAASTSRDSHARRVARLQVEQDRAVLFLMSRLLGRKVGEVVRMPLAEWRSALTDFDPKRDFALAMLHAERLVRILTDVAVAEILLAQAEKHAERVEVLDRWLERAEPRVRFDNDVIHTTGTRLLSTLSGADTEAKAAK